MKKYIFSTVFSDKTPKLPTVEESSLNISKNNKN